MMVVSKVKFGMTARTWRHGPMGMMAARWRMMSREGRLGETKMAEDDGTLEPRTKQLEQNLKK